VLPSPATPGMRQSVCRREGIPLQSDLFVLGSPPGLSGSAVHANLLTPAHKCVVTTVAQLHKQHETYDVFSCCHPCQFSESLWATQAGNRCFLSLCRRCASNHVRSIASRDNRASVGERCSTIRPQQRTGKHLHRMSPTAAQGVSIWESCLCIPEQLLSRFLRGLGVAPIPHYPRQSLPQCDEERSTSRAGSPKPVRV